MTAYTDTVTMIITSSVSKTEQAEFIESKTINLISSINVYNHVPYTITMNVLSTSPIVNVRSIGEPNINVRNL